MPTKPALEFVMNVDYGRSEKRGDPEYISAPLSSTTLLHADTLIRLTGSGVDLVMPLERLSSLTIKRRDSV